MNRPVTKIIPILMTLMLCVQVLSPFQANAGALNYDYPNGSSPYKLKSSDVVNSEVFMSVVGCTGIVNKVAGAIQGLISDITDAGADALEKAMVKLGVKKAAEISAAAASTTAVGNGVPGATTAIVATLEDPLINADAPVVNKQAQIDAQRTACLNGIAIQLARNQLTAMTRDTMNWVTTGFNGSPFYVEEANSFMNNLTNDIVKRESDLLVGDNTMQYYPYGRTFAQNTTSMLQRAVHSTNLYAQNLTNALILDDGDTSETAINKFSTDFSRGGLKSSSGTTYNTTEGGWGGWMYLTQYPQNNPLGFQLLESKKISDEQANAVANTQATLNQNGGYLNQQQCVKWQTEDLDGHLLYNDDGSATTTTSDPGVKGICLLYKTVTPGSTIRDKISKYINSPETQLELVQTMNDALNNLFSSLIGHLFDQGLTGLSPSYINNSKTYDRYGTSSSGNTTDLNSGSGFNGSFDLTRDIPTLITTQQNYITIANKSLKEVLPLIKPTVGALDYCIPGPNPNWQKNINDAVTNLDDYLGMIRTQQLVIPDIHTEDCDHIGDFAFNCKIVPFANATIMVLPNASEFKSAFDGTDLWTKASAILSSSIPTFTPYKIEPRTEMPGFVSSDVPTTVPESNNPPLFTPDGSALGPFRSFGQVFEQKSMIIKVNAEAVDSKIANWTNYIKKMKVEYSDKINKLYGPSSPMQSGLSADGFSESTDYLPMAQAGLSITKNLKTYADDVDAKTKDYTASITQANANIYKLKKIAEQVNVIVTAARKQRDDFNKANGLPVFPKDCLDGKIDKTTTPPTISVPAEVINITGNNCINESGNKLDSNTNKIITIECVPTFKKTP